MFYSSAPLYIAHPLPLRDGPAEGAAPEQPLSGEELGGLAGLHRGAALVAPELPAPGPDRHQHEGELSARPRRASH